MFRSHDIGGRELQEIHEAVQNEKVLPSLAKEMPEGAVNLIEKMIKKRPQDRPTPLEVLTSEALPQDEILQSLMPHLSNHKSSVKLQLMRFLGMLDVPKALQLQYHGSLREDLRQLNKNSQTQTEAPTPGLPKTSKKLEAAKKTKIQLQKHLALETLREKVERKVIAEL